jgi:Flp pilus assembly pilin Flp
MKSLKFSRAKNTLCGRVLRRLLGEENGAVAMEYIVIALLVAAAVVALVGVFGGRIATMFHDTTDSAGSTSLGESKNRADTHQTNQTNIDKANDKALEIHDEYYDPSSEEGTGS